MPKALAYYRPGTLDEALELLGSPRRAVLGGGTVMNAPAGDPVELVDIQALGLDGLSLGAGRVRCGSMVTLQSLMEDDGVPRLVREAAGLETSSVLRNQATVGGTIAGGDPDSVLLAALVVSDAVVELAGSEGAFSSPLTDVLGAVPAGGIITAVTFAADGVGTIAATGRTPRDTPIVAAVGRKAGAGVELALTGAGPVVQLVDPATLSDIDPTSDFRGSSRYRRHLAAVLVGRVIEELGG